MAQFDHTVAMRSSRRRVWGALQDPDTWAALGPITAVWGAEFADDGHLAGFRWSADGPRKIEGSAATLQALEPELMVMSLDASEVVGTLTTELQPNGQGTMLTVVLSVEAKGMLATLFFSVISEALGRGLPGQVEGFAATFDG